MASSPFQHTGLCSNAHCCLEPHKGWTFCIMTERNSVWTNWKQKSQLYEMLTFCTMPIPLKAKQSQLTGWLANSWNVLCRDRAQTPPTIKVIPAIWNLIFLPYRTKVWTEHFVNKFHQSLKYNFFDVERSVDEEKRKNWKLPWKFCLSFLLVSLLCHLAGEDEQQNE